MRAIVWTEYGPPEVLKLKEVEKPAPKENEVLIKIYATTVTSGDCEQRSLKLPIFHRLPIQAYVGFSRPVRISIMGMDLAGEIVSVGKDVKRFGVGDKVFATTGFAAMGTYAEYICLPEESEEGALAIKPENMSYEEAAAVPTGGLEALSCIRQGDIQRGEKVLINGAGGTIGTFAVQLTKYYGAEVTAVDSTEKLEMLLSLGADHIIDYTQEDYSKSGKTYDFILDIVGGSPFSGSYRSLKPSGRYLIVDPGMAQMVRGRWTSMRSSLPGLRTGKKVIFGAASPKSEDLVYLKGLIEAAKMKSVIDRSYPLEQIPEAHRYVETGVKKGHVVITVAGSSSLPS